MLACRYFKVAQSKEQNIGSLRPYGLNGAVRCAVSLTAVAAAFGLAACSNAGIQTHDSNVAAKLNLTVPVEEKLGSTEMLARGATLHAIFCQPWEIQAHISQRYDQAINKKNKDP